MFEPLPSGAVSCSNYGSRFTDNRAVFIHHPEETDGVNIHLRRMPPLFPRRCGTFTRQPLLVKIVRIIGVSSGSMPLSDSLGTAARPSGRTCSPCNEIRRSVLWCCCLMHAEMLPWNEASAALQSCSISNIICFAPSIEDNVKRGNATVIGYSIRYYS